MMGVKGEKENLEINMMFNRAVKLLRSNMIYGGSARNVEVCKLAIY